MKSKELLDELTHLADSKIAEHSQKFFKTGKGEYGEGDVFLGIRVPLLRKKAKAYRELDLGEIEKIMHSKYHEVRLCALLVLVEKYQRAEPKLANQIYKLYLNSTKVINNWDLVDSSAHKIVGPHLYQKDTKPLFKLAKSKWLWDRRIAIISTYYFIKRGDFKPTLELAEMLLSDGEDLMHKAVGWMLREVGKKDGAVERDFLNQHAKVMPRTMLRYAIEHLPEKERKNYLHVVSRS